MKIVANRLFKNGSTIYNKGDVIEGLSKKDLKRLNLYIVFVEEDKKVIDKPDFKKDIITK